MTPSIIINHIGDLKKMEIFFMNYSEGLAFKCIKDDVFR